VTTDLIIAEKLIRFQSDGNFAFRLDGRFDSFIVSDREAPELIVEVNHGRAVVPDGAVKVFDAGLVEETSEGPGDPGEPFWEVMSDGDVIYAKVLLKDTERSPVLIIPRGGMTWHLFADTSDPDNDVLPYPLDGLLLYFLASIKGEIMIHGSGVVCNGRGWVFTGRSGSGKTTMAMIFDRRGDRVIHDDRLILMRQGGRWVMHSTPVYRDDEPRSAGVDHLWIISHGRSNVSSPLTGAEAAALIIANCIQQNWDRDTAARLMASVDDLVSSVKISSLSFMPDDRVRDYLMAHESNAASLTTEAASSLLKEGKQVVVTAGGYSMWPVLKPGDRIIISPFNRDIPLTAGMVIALRRDGGFIVHRVSEFRRGKLSVFIRTRGDASMIIDPWTTVRDVAGLVEKITPDNRRQMVSARRMPYLISSLAVMMILIWRSVTRRKGKRISH
jgi:hypothetical protein